MPNWCECQLTIDGGNEEEVKQFKEVMDFMKSDRSPFDFNKIIPYPKNFVDMDDRAHEYGDKILALQERYDGKNTPEHTAELDALYKEYGVDPNRPWMQDGFNSGGYEWCIANWGTKWYLSDEVTVEEEDYELTYKFETAWTPPTPVVIALARRFPNLRFLLEFWEGGAAYQGTLLCVNGEVEIDKTVEYYGRRGG